VNISQYFLYRKNLLTVLLLWMIVFWTEVSAQQSEQIISSTYLDSSLCRIEHEIMRLAQPAEGIVGVAAIHIETNLSVSYNGDISFPMASTFKIPIAVQLLSLIDRGELSLDEVYNLKQSDLHPGSGTLADLFSKPGVTISLHNLLELMLLISDNSATDILITFAGGPEAITSRMRSLDIDEIRVDHPTNISIANWLGFSNLPSDRVWTPEVFKTFMDEIPSTQKREAEIKFDNDIRNSATPRAMTMLLQRIFLKAILKPESTEILLDIMERCKTGDTRLKGFLPAGTIVAHKTGTTGMSTNDVGIISLPDKMGHIAVAVFIKSSEKTIPERERVIAHISRAIYDFFLFLPTSTLTMKH
jgi:beta-lactamase class A